MRFKQDPDSNDHHDRDEFGRNSRSRRDRESDYERSRSPKRRREDDGYNRYDDRFDRDGRDQSSSSRYDRRSSSDQEDDPDDRQRDRDYRNDRRSSYHQRQDGDRDRKRMASSDDRRPNSSSGGGNTSYAEPLDIKIEGGELANESCAYICELPDNVTKDSLIRFICKRYWKVRKINPKIIACSIRDYKNDACVQFRDPYHARHAEEALDKAKFQDFKIRVPRWEFKYLNMFKLEAYSTIKEEAEPKDNPNDNQAEGEQENGEVEAPKGPAASTYDKSSPIGYFKDRQKTDKSIYIYNLPPKLKYADLKKFIVHHYAKARESKPEVVDLYLRSQKNDACVEFKTNAHANVAVEILDCRDIKSKEVRVKLWDPKFSEQFTKYYQEKDDRKKQKHANKENTSEIVRLANEKLESEKTAETNKLVESLKADNDHLRENLSSMTRDHDKLKQDRTSTIQENEELKQQLLARDREKRRAVEKLSEEANSTIMRLQMELAEAQKTNEQLKQELKGQQEDSFGKQQKLDGVKEELSATQMKLHKKKNFANRIRQLQNLTGSVKNEAYKTESNDVDI
jgi:hypothetical protein